MIVTFYSYKGGVGRSMALANVADILARRGARVLMLDFDLEAPGLEQFFQINQSGARRHAGLLDLLLDYKHSMSVSAGGREGSSFKQLTNFILPVYETLPGGGRLDLMSAGQREETAQLERYAVSVRSFDWQDFYFNWEGELFFEWLRQSLVPDPYDVVLVDSRTGVTEMGGICAYQLADTIVMFCAANHQNVGGTINMVRDFSTPKVRAMRQGRPLELLVVPARVEQRDPTLLNKFADRFNGVFAGYLPETLARAGRTFWDLMIPYEAEYAFEERVLTEPAQTGERQKIRRAFDRLAETILTFAAPGSKLAQFAPTQQSAGETATETRQETTAAPQYNVASRFAGYDIFIDYGREDLTQAEDLARQLREMGFQIFMDVSDLRAGADSQAVLDDALFHSRALVVCVGSAGLSTERQFRLRSAVASKIWAGQAQIVPVLLPGGEWRMLGGTPIADFQGLDFRDGLNESEIAQLHRAVAAQSTAAPSQEVEFGPPFVGVRAFSEEDAPVYFGREALVERMIKLVGERRFLALVGPSGCGKTSVVTAGLIPSLRRGSVAGKQWNIATVQIGLRRPLAALAESLAHWFPGKTAEEIAGLLASSGQALAQLLKTAFGGGSKSGATPFIFADQFEALFRTDCDPGEREAFIDNLATAAQNGAGVVILVAIRSDFYAVCASHAKLGALLQSCRIDVTDMDRDELRRVIEKPAQRIGLAFEPGLVDRILSDVQGQPHALPLLQPMLAALWERRRSGWLTNCAYDEVGGIRGALARGAEGLYSGLTPEEQSATRQIFLHLIELGQGTEYTGRQLAVDDLIPRAAEAHQGRMEAYRSAVDKLIAARLLSASEVSGKRVVEPVHETLVRGWPRLRSWIDEEREFLIWLQRLRAYKAEWSESGKAAKALLRGEPLREAQRRMQVRPDDLGAEEILFISQSGFASRRRRRWAIGTATAASIVVTVLAAAAVFQTFYARNIEQAASLVSQADEIVPRDRRKAIDLYSEAIRTDPGIIQAYFKRGLLFEQGGNLRGALADFNKTLELDPRNADAFLHRGSVLLGLGDNKGAVENIGTAASVFPANAVIRLNQGLTLARLGDFPSAVSSYTEAIRLNPDAAEAYFNRGAALQQMGLKEQAIADFQRTLRLPTADPNMQRASETRLQELGAGPKVQPRGRIGAPVNVFLQFSDESDRPIVTLLQQRLKEQGFVVPGIERKNIPVTGEVRYFYFQDEKRAMDAKSIVESTLADRGISLRVRASFFDAKAFPAAKPGLIEIWLPPLLRQLPAMRY